MSSKLTIQNEMRAYDRKERDFYDDLTEEERKKFSTYLMLKYGANVEGSADLQEWYLRVVNDRVNQNFFELGQHPKLQWLLCTTVSPDMGTQRHYWLNPRKETNKTARAEKFLAAEFPHLSDSEVELMASINTREQLVDMARGLGWDDREISAKL